MSLRSRGLHSRRGHGAMCQRVGQLDGNFHMQVRLTHSLPLVRPADLRLSGSAPAGRIPAGDTTSRARRLANLRVVQSEGSIDSCSPQRSPLRGFVYPSRLPPDAFPPGHDTTHQSLASLRVVQSEGSIDSLSPESSPLRGFVYVALLPPSSISAEDNAAQNFLHCQAHAVFLETNLASDCASSTVPLFREIDARRRND
jgi:hypothetical protein